MFIVISLPNCHFPLLLSFLGCPESSHSNCTENISDSWEDRSKGSYSNHLNQRITTNPGPKMRGHWRKKTLPKCASCSCLVLICRFGGRGAEFSAEHIQLPCSANMTVYLLLYYGFTIFLYTKNYERGRNALYRDIITKCQHRRRYSGVLHLILHF